MDDNKKKKDIKIFVSHRIDLDSETIDNPLYVNVRCGAVFDKREGITMLGDDTGDNISEKRESFCEFTVMYWAWKNVKADYYGLCHYRRYLSFADEKYDETHYGLIDVDCISSNNIDRFKLNENTIRKAVEEYDLITAVPVDVGKIDSRISNIYDYCKLFARDFNIKDIDILLDLIKEEYNEYYSEAVHYYKQPYSRWYNCFIMKSDLFQNMCSWIFEILFKLEERIDSSQYSVQMSREIGFFGEHLYGIYINHLIKKGKIKYKELQVIKFNYTKKVNELLPYFETNNIPLILLVSNYYIPYASVLINSLIQNRDLSKNYDVIICEKNITDDNKEKILKSVKNISNISIRFYNMTATFSGYSLYIASKYYAEEAYYRLMVPWVFKQYDKVIVMDCDIVFKDDISKLYTIDIDGYYIGAVIDVVFHGMLKRNVNDNYRYCVETIKMKNPFNYVNTGVMLMNSKFIRDNISQEYVLKYSSTHNFRIQEQDIINGLFQEKIKLLDIKFNYYITLNDWIKECLYYAPKKSLNMYNEARNEAVILHWASQPKPWLSPEIPMADEWWHFARKTEFYEIILARMSASQNLPYIPNMSFVRRLADKHLPKGSKRRELLKKIMPRGSWLFNKLRIIYHKISLD